MRFTITAVFVFIFYANGISQTGIDSAVSAPLPRDYYETFTENAPIFNGRQFLGHPTINGVYLYPQKNEKGSVTYDGILYEDLIISYDTYVDEVILRYNQNFVRLARNKVSSFTIDDKLFEKFDTVRYQVPNTFFETIADGNVKLLAQRKVAMLETLEELKVRREFIDDNRFYIFENDKFSQVRSGKSLLKLLKIKGSGFRRSLRAKNITYKNNREEFILAAVNYHNQK